jgi:hypothetical protein
MTGSTVRSPGRSSRHPHGVPPELTPTALQEDLAASRFPPRQLNHAWLPMSPPEQTPLAEGRSRIADTGGDSPPFRSEVQCDFRVA